MLYSPADQNNLDSSEPVVGEQGLVKRTDPRTSPAVLQHDIKANLPQSEMKRTRAAISAWQANDHCPRARGVRFGSVCSGRLTQSRGLAPVRPRRQFVSRDYCWLVSHLSDTRRSLHRRTLSTHGWWSPPHLIPSSHTSFTLLFSVVIP